MADATQRLAAWRKELSEIQSVIAQYKRRAKSLERSIKDAEK